LVLIAAAYAQLSSAQQTGGQPPQGQGGGGACGKNTLTFGCHAYIYGNSGSAPSYAGRADSVFIDAQHMSQNPGMAQRLNQTGPFPMFYTNAYCEKRFGWGCGGPQLSGSSVAAQYGEVAQHPNSGQFFSNFTRQLDWVKRAQGKVIEIDNMDFYIEKGHKAAIIKLIQMAANAGINVLSKNVKDRDILSLPNVVGVVVEEGSGNAPEYHAAFAAVGKPCAGVLMINARSKAGNQYTSFTECDHPSRGSKSEYTKCSCKKNTAGMQIAGTPVAGPNVDIPPEQLVQQYQQNQQPQQTFAQETPASQQPSSGGSSSSAQSQPQSPQPQSPPQLSKLPDAINEKPTQIKDPSIEKLQPKDSFVKDSLGKKIDALKEKVEKAQEEDTTFYDPLGGKKDGDREAFEKKKSVQKPFGDAKIRCMPTTVFAGARPTIAWSCGKHATSSEGISFDSRNYLLGSARVTPSRTTLYAVNCYEEGELVGSAQCTIRVNREKSADESFGTGEKKKEEVQPKKLCFLAFCI
jgi:hypothetical protein